MSWLYKQSRTVEITMEMNTVPHEMVRVVPTDTDQDEKGQRSGSCFFPRRSDRSKEEISRLVMGGKKQDKRHRELADMEVDVEEKKRIPSRRLLCFACLPAD